MPQVFRIVKEKYKDSALSGYGAYKFGGRWNSKGFEVVYTAESRALAMAETLVHIPKHMQPEDLWILTIEIPEGLEVATLDKKLLPGFWNVHPPKPVTAEFGDRWLEKESTALLRVPSAVVEGDYNVLLNPQHPDFPQIKVRDERPFSMDKRFFD